MHYHLLTSAAPKQEEMYLATPTEGGALMHYHLLTSAAPKQEEMYLASPTEGGALMHYHLTSAAPKQEEMYLASPTRRRKKDSLYYFSKRKILSLPSNSPSQGGQLCILNCNSSAISSKPVFSSKPSHGCFILMADRVYSWCIFLVFSHMYSVRYPPLSSWWDSFTALKVICTLPVYPSFLQIPGSH